jgi:hemoglobin-like flavoprotein
MMKELSYFTVSTVIDSWESLKRKENYAEDLGRDLFIKFFDRKPEAKAIFGFDSKKMKNDEDFYKSRAFLAHGKHFVSILNRAFDMLGPNLEMLTEILLDLGGTHRTKYGVKPEYFPILGVCLLECIEEILGPKEFTNGTKSCWLEVYTALTDIMTIRKTQKARRMQ